MPKISGVCVGESLVGDGNEVAHVDLLLGPRGSAVETAYCHALTNNKDGFTTLLALVAPNLMCKPPTILYNKVTIKDARQAVQMFGPAQHGVAKAVANSVAEGVIPANEADDLYITVGVFIHWEAKDDKKIQDFNYRATKEAIARAVRGEPKASEVTAKKTQRTIRSLPVEKENPQVGGNPTHQLVRAQFGGGSKSGAFDRWRIVKRHLAPVPCPGLSGSRLRCRRRFSLARWFDGGLLMTAPNHRGSISSRAPNCAPPKQPR